jgi:anion-transporting  ArsA/GET3 family ATPase
MQSLLARKLLVITGKGGVGKSTMAAAVGMLAAREGRRTIVVEVGEQSRLAELFGVHEPEPGAQVRLERNLSTISIDPDQALLEWLQALGGRVSGRLLASSGTFQYFAAAAPGAKELVSMVKVWQLTRGGRRDGSHELVVLDAPATGHALGMLASPRTFGAIARVGPVAGQTRHVQELLQDPARTAYIAVALATEMAVTEALEVQEGLQRELGRELAAVIVNELLPRRFTPAEMTRIDALEPAVAGAGRRQRAAGTRGGRAVRAATESRRVEDACNGALSPELARAAVHAARAVHERSRFQHNQLARLRRRSFEVLGVPFVWGEGLDLEAVRSIGEHLGRKL